MYLLKYSIEGNHQILLKNRDFAFYSPCVDSFYSHSYLLDELLSNVNIKTSVLSIHE